MLRKNLSLSVCEVQIYWNEHSIKPSQLQIYREVGEDIFYCFVSWQRTKDVIMGAPLDIMDELPCRALKFISHSQKKVMQKNLFMIFLSYRTTMHSLSSPVCFFVFNFQAWKWCVFPLLIYLTERLTRVFRSFQKVELIDVKNFASTFKLSDALELLHAVFSF